MLKKTFLHLPGIAEHTERLIWDAGVGSWMDFMNTASLPGMTAHRVGVIRGGVLESIQRYEREDWRYFETHLPGRHKWRAYGDFPGRSLYVDIETDGSIGPESITVIGAYDGKTARAFVQDRDLDEAAAYLAGFPVIVTFNGARFDMPVIRSHFGSHLFNQIHIDLLYPLKRLGLHGGLKQIEKRVGLQRTRDTAGLDGWDAVRLWSEFRAGSREALALLLKYNEEDVCNLKPLMERVFRDLSATLGEDRRA